MNFDRTSRHFRAIRNLDFFFTKMAACGHFGWPIAFLAISGQYSIFYFVHKMAASDHFGWPKITFHRSIHNFCFLKKKFQNGLRPLFWKSLLGHFGWPKINFDRISRHFRSIHNSFFCNFFFKMAASGHFGSPICAKNNRVLPLCVINGYAKYEVDRWICDTSFLSILSIFIQNGRQRPFCFSD